MWASLQTDHRTQQISSGLGRLLAFIFVLDGGGKMHRMPAPSRQQDLTLHAEATPDPIRRPSSQRLKLLNVQEFSVAVHQSLTQRLPLKSSVPPPDQLPVNSHESTRRTSLFLFSSPVHAASSFGLSDMGVSCRCAGLTLHLRRISIPTAEDH